MSARDCLKGKIALGKVSQAAGNRILAIVRDAEQRAGNGDATAMRDAMNEAYAIAGHEAVRKQAVAAGNIVAQAAILERAATYDSRIAALRKTEGDLGFGNKAPPGMGKNQTTLGAAVKSMLVRDVWEIASDRNNVFYLGRALRAEAHAKFTSAIEYLRPKKLGLVHETAREGEVLDALYGRDAGAQAKTVARAFGEIAESQRQDFNKAAGYEAIPKREDWRIGNPTMQAAKVQAWSPDGFALQVGQLLDRGKMIDFATGQRMSDQKLGEVLRDVWETGRLDGAEGAPNAGYVGEGPLSARRASQRTLMFKDPESWQKFNELFGGNVGVYDSMLRHFAGMAQDTAIMRVFGPDPAASKRFIESMFDREAAAKAVTGDEGSPKSMKAAVRENQKTAARVSVDRWQFESLWGHMTGTASIPVNVELAKATGNVRSVLMASQLGTSILAALTDTGLVAGALRFNGLPVMDTLRAIVQGMGTKGHELNAAQLGLVADTIAHGAADTDRYMGETIRSAIPAKMANTVLRGIGHRRWTGVIRATFGQEFMARMANAMEAGTGFADLPFRAALERYGVGEAEWSAMKAVPLYEPRDGAKFLRPMDVRATEGMAETGEKLGRMIQTEIDYTAIEGDPVTRGLMLGETRPGTVTGEILRGIGMYRSWPVTILTTQMARAFARGWDGSRLGHAAFTFMAMTMMGALAMQAKEVTAGRDPLSMDPATPEGRSGWAKAVMQGGGFGVFGDLAFADKTKMGDSWAATVGGPFMDLGERVLGQWLIKNIQLASHGKETNFFGDAIYIGSRYMPGSNVFYWRLAFDRAVLDQILLHGDPKAPERFQRIEERARAEAHQSYWWRRGEATPARAPDIGAIGGGR